MSCKVLNCQGDRMATASRGKMFFAQCHKVVTKREFFEMITDSGVDTF